MFEARSISAVMVGAMLTSFLALPAKLYGQDATLPQVNPQTPSEYFYQRSPRDTMISVRLLGNVRRPGIYHVPRDFDLYSLMSLAGSYSEQADLSAVRIVRGARGQQGSVIEVDLENRAKVDAVRLQADDVVWVKEEKALISTDTYRLATVFSVVISTLLTVFLIVDRIES